MKAFIVKLNLSEFVCIYPVAASDSVKNQRIAEFIIRLPSLTRATVSMSLNALKRGSCNIQSPLIKA